MLVYRKRSMDVQEIFQMLHYLPTSNSIDIIALDFSYNRLKMSQNKLLDIFTNHIQLINRSTHISGSLKASMEEFFTNVTVENIYFVMNKHSQNPINILSKQDVMVY